MRYCLLSESSRPRPGLARQTTYGSNSGIAHETQQKQSQRQLATKTKGKAGSKMACCSGCYAGLRSDTDSTSTGLVPGVPKHG